MSLRLILPPRPALSTPIRANEGYLGNTAAQNMLIVMTTDFYVVRYYLEILLLAYLVFGVQSDDAVT